MLTFRLEEFLILRQDSLGSVSKLIELQNFSQLACVFTLSSSLICFCKYCLLSLRFSLIGPNVSSEMGLLSDSTLLDFRMALSTAVLIADTIKSVVYLSRSLVDVSLEKSSEPISASSVDSNTSPSAWSNFYLVWLVVEFLCGGASIETSVGR